MNFDQLGSELLQQQHQQQQPLLSAQIIPDLADDVLVKVVKPAAVMEKPVKITQQQNTNKVIQQNATPIQIKTTAVPTQKVQYVKRIPTNVIQVSDPKPTVKQQNNAIFNENMVTSTPIVINKVNGNISGMDRNSIEID